MRTLTLSNSSASAAFAISRKTAEEKAAKTTRARLRFEATRDGCLVIGRPQLSMEAQPTINLLFRTSDLTPFTVPMAVECGLPTEFGTTSGLIARTAQRLRN